MTTKWTMPEYIAANPTKSNYEIIKTFMPHVPDETSTEYTEDADYKELNELISAYKESLSNNTAPLVTILNQLLDVGIAYLPDVKTINTTTEITPKDNDPLAYLSNFKSIVAVTEIGGYDVTLDVISINTTQTTSVDEGNEQSTCSIVLNNNYQKYGKLISSYEWAPRVTRIWSTAVVPINSGSSTEYYYYTIFTGFLSDAKYNEETAELTFGCVGIIGSASYEENSWSTEDGPYQKMEKILEGIEEGSEIGIKLTLKDLRANTNIQLKKQFFAPSDISGSENLRSVAQDDKLSYYFATDYGGEETFVFITDSSSKTLYIDLGDYVVNPGDVSTIFGHANKITTIGGTPISNVPTLRHIPTNVKNEVISIKTNLDSISKYGIIPSYINHDVNLDSSQIDIETDLCDDNYQQYIDRDIKITVASMIPKLLSVVTFQVPDMQTRNHTYIYAGVKKKQVEFSSGGLLTHLECARLDDGEKAEMEANESGIVTEPEGIQIGDDYWRFKWENGKWQAYVNQNYNSNLFTTPIKWTGEIPENVSLVFDPLLSNIEQNNNIIDPDWKTKYGN